MCDFAFTECVMIGWAHVIAVFQHLDLSAFGFAAKREQKSPGQQSGQELWAASSKTLSTGREARERRKGRVSGGRGREVEK